MSDGAQCCSAETCPSIERPGCVSASYIAIRGYLYFTDRAGSALDGRPDPVLCLRFRHEIKLRPRVALNFLWPQLSCPPGQAGLGVKDPQPVRPGESLILWRRNQARTEKKGAGSYLPSAAALWQAASSSWNSAALPKYTLEISSIVLIKKAPPAFRKTQLLPYFPRGPLLRNCAFCAGSQPRL